MKTHNLEKGLQLDKPELFIPWKIDERELIRLANPLGLIDRSDEYNVYVLPCSMFGIDNLEMVFRFDMTPGSLQRVEFQIVIQADDDFENTQFALRKALGTETRHIPFSKKPREDEENGSGYYWTFGDTEMSHHIWDSADGPIQMIVIENGEFEFSRSLVWYPFTKV